MSKALKFRKKPVIIEAMQHDGTVRRGAAICDWMRHCGAPTDSFANTGRALKIRTLESDKDEWLTVGCDDWVIRGIAGEFYPCKPDIFAATYEAVR